jgi:ech hydrogenase subunit D
MIQMKGQNKIIDIEAPELLKQVQDMKGNGFRLVQISCTRLNDIFELYYSFDKDYDFINIKLNITAEVEIPSISFIYQPAFLYENEIHDLFGIKINNISIDYNGGLYKMSVKTPFGCNNPDVGGNKA